MNLANKTSRGAIAFALILLALLTAGCAATYVPVSWNYRVKARQLAQTDPKLAILFGHCDPKFTTLRFEGQSFSQVMMPDEVPHHFGAYRRDTGLIYSNLEYRPNDRDLRDLLVHEVSHHCWFNTLTDEQRLGWGAHLMNHPSALQTMVRVVYENPADFDTEDFAFTMEFARPVDIEALVALQAITREEGDILLKEPTPTMPKWHVQKGTSAEGNSRVEAKP